MDIDLTTFLRNLEQIVEYFQKRHLKGNSRVDRTNKAISKSNRFGSLIVILLTLSVPVTKSPTETSISPKSRPSGTNKTSFGEKLAALKARMRASAESGHMHATTTSGCVSRKIYERNIG